MKKIFTKILSVSTILFTLSFGSANATQNPEYVNLHGSACQPIFLQQALDKSLKWTRQGVFNDNPLGSGVFFWVACPLAVTDDGSNPNGADIYVGLFYEDRDGSAATRTFCFAMRQSHNTHLGGTTQGQIGARPSATDPAGGVGRRADDIVLSNLINEGDRFFQANLESSVVACKLYPQAGIRHMAVDFD